MGVALYWRTSRLSDCKMILFGCLLSIFFTQMVGTQALGVHGDEEYGSFREYGKNGVKVLYLNDHNKYHQVSEITVKTRIMLNNDDEYRDISIAGVIATDTQKNIIYILAKKAWNCRTRDLWTNSRQFFSGRIP